MRVHKKYEILNEMWWSSTACKNHIFGKSTTKNVHHFTQSGEHCTCTHVVHKQERICSNAQTQNKAYHILWFVYDVPCYFIVGRCCLPLAQCMCIRTDWAHCYYAIASCAFTTQFFRLLFGLFVFRELVSIPLFVWTHKNNGKGIRQQSQKKKFAQNIPCNA